MFKPGAAVYIGWCPDDTVTDPRARPYRCRCGVILDGPFQPNHRMIDTWWKVEVDGRALNACERILFPFNPPSESETRESEREVTA